MASSKAYLEYVLEQLSELSDVKYRPMMGEYIVYYHGKVIGGIYDDRLLVKRTESLKTLLPNAPLQMSYEGGKEMVLIEDLEDKELLAEIFKVLYDEIPSKNGGK